MQPGATASPATAGGAATAIVIVALSCTGARHCTMSAPTPLLDFSHMGVFATDVEKLGQFYQDVLGFSRTDKGTMPGPGGNTLTLVFLSRDPEEHHQIVLCSGRPEGSFNTVNQISFKTPSCTELKRIWAGLKLREDISELVAVTHGTSVSCYFKDPEGNRVEVFCNSQFYCYQPIRGDIDLDKTESEIWAAVEAHARASPDFKMRSEWLAEMTALMAKDQGAAAGGAAAAPPQRIVRFVDAESGNITYGEPVLVDGAVPLDISEAQELLGDPLSGAGLRHSGRVAKVGKILSPIVPTNILCVGLNYMKHYEEGAKSEAAPPHILSP
jgi:catechol 2,3-dioxygenase-like lactoylglutathione lyase family enzyme